MKNIKSSLAASLLIIGGLIFSLCQNGIITSSVNSLGFNASLEYGQWWIFSPETPYEREGDVGHVVFPCGQTIGEDGDTINLYYGAADTSVALATGSIRGILSWLDVNGGPPT